MEDDQSQVCAVCLNLCYERFTPKDGDISPRRVNTVGFDELKHSVDKGCRICCVLQQAVRIFWGSSPDREGHSPEEKIWEIVEPALSIKISGGGVGEHSENDEPAGSSHRPKVVGDNNSAESGKHGGIDNYEQDCVDESDEEGYESGFEVERSLLWLHMVIRPGKSMILQRSESGTKYDYAAVTRGVELYTKIGIIRTPRDWPTKLSFASGEPQIHPAFGHSRDVPVSLELETCKRMLHAWMKDCILNHSNCREDAAPLPKRVIQISGSSFRLIEPPPYTLARYVTLSHCWGEHPELVFKTTLENLDDRKSGIKWEELNPVFQDTLTITKLINCDYLWIDSLCIIQDDEADWREQSLKMSEIYSHSTLNIAATSSPNGSTGYFTGRQCFSDLYGDPRGFHQLSVRSWELKSSSDQPLSIFVRPVLEDGHDYVMRNMVNRRWQVAPLLTRAWVLQERLLAPRNLHFSASELIWECRSTLSCECTGLDSPSTGPYSTHQVSSVEEVSIYQSSRVPRQFFKGHFAQVCGDSNSIQETFNFWLLAVECYSKLSLSRSSDVAVALAGIAQRVRDHIELEYAAGIWIGDLARGLLWMGTPRSSLKATRRSASMPTWSWMSRSTRHFPDDPLCSLIYHDALLDGFLQDERFQVHGYSIKFESDNDGLFSSPKSGQVEITGAWLPATITLEPLHLSIDSRMDFRVNLHCDDNTYSELLCADCPYWDVGRGPLLEGEEVCCLLIGTTEERSYTEQTEHVLVLRKVEEQASCYERIGISVFCLYEYRLFQDAPVSRIEIV
ncbi:hypothetical protein EPUS_05330 [Endocarpon pusillum Z07020]|uniref:Heterokaryon incompatibility domain-containing protein n=1 Tax=Endocarpon pusillum (strain Z07020 / HMAS-L-300199) TaxID=1263415 RepID=U1GGP3_ENDPU|nr:uncharacterized protein EPUS_05330 [Endocarpon pusillum Z07020]ERF71278.1 hypothetical protein EPUS_05330 [Endocarpon pusillum Z07020]